MSDSDNLFSGGPGSPSGRPPLFGAAGATPFGTPPGSPPPGSPPPVAPSARSHAILVGSLIVLAVLATGVAGAVIGHSVWKTSAPLASAAGPTGQAPSGGFGGRFGNGGGFANGGFPGGGFGRSGSGSTPAATGAPANVSAIAAKVDPGLVDIDSSLNYESASGAGTGIVISSNGEVLTNNHVIEEATSLTATDLGNGKTYTAKVVGYDPTQDIAVVQLEGASGLKTADLGDSSQVKVDEPIVAIGNAGGVGGTPSAAGGEVTGLNASITAGDEASSSTEHLSGLIQINADVQAGDSGGSLVNSQGQVVGMDTAASAGFYFSTSSNEAYAIPINQALATAKQISAGTASTDVHIGGTAFLGVQVTPPSSTGSGFGGFGQGFGNSGGSSSSSPSIAGATIQGVVNGEPAQKAGLGAGDVITSIDGQSIASSTGLTKLLFGHHPGDTIMLGWSDTKGHTHTSKLTLASGPPA